jgi:hypothetical protein
VTAASATGGLFFGQEHAALDRSSCGFFHRLGIRGAKTEIMMHTTREYGRVDQRFEDLGQRQVGNFDELITNGGMAGDLHAEAAELLYESPNVRARRSDFFRKFGSADDESRVVGEHADDLSETFVIGRIRSCGGVSNTAICARSRDAVIIHLRKNETQMESPHAILARLYRGASSSPAACKLVRTPECNGAFYAPQSRIPSVKGTNMWTVRLRSSVLLMGVLAFTLLTSAAFAADPAKATFRASADAPSYVAPYIRPIEPRKPHTEHVVDAKFVGMSALAMGLTVADIESTQHCLRNGTCRELNPLMPHSRLGMYAVNVPVNALAMFVSYRLKAGGHKTWWIAPIAISGAHAVGAGFVF